MVIPGWIILWDSNIFLLKKMEKGLIFILNNIQKVAVFA